MRYLTCQKKINKLKTKLLKKGNHTYFSYIDTRRVSPLCSDQTCVF